MDQLKNFHQYLGNEFPFLKRNNKFSYFKTEPRQRRKSTKQINDYLSWIHKTIISKYISKYRLKIHKIDIAQNDSDDDEELKVEINNTRTQNSDRLPFSMYEQKEKSHMSDKSYQEFINAGANFPSLRFVKSCRKHLNSKFNFQKNTFGNFTFISSFFK